MSRAVWVVVFFAAAGCSSTVDQAKSSCAAKGLEQASRDYDSCVRQETCRLESEWEAAWARTDSDLEQRYRDEWRDRARGNTRVLGAAPR